MKKAYIFLILTLAVMTASCTREMVFRRGGDVRSADIRLSVFSLDPQTRATETGDSLYKYNENKIHDYWYYITSDAAGTSILASGYSADGADVSLVADDLLASLTDNTCYVYVFANVPKSSTSDKTDYSGNPIQREDLLLDAAGNEYTMTGEETFADLQALCVSSSFYDDYKDSRNRTGINGNIHTDNHFVMLSKAPQEIVLEEGDNTVSVGLARVASKVSLALDVVKEIDQFTHSTDGSETYEKTWIAQYDKIQIYLMWVSKYGDVKGTPIHYSQSTSGGGTSQYFFSYPRYSMFDTGKAGGTLIPTVDATQSKDFVSYLVGDVPSEEIQALHPENTYEREIVDGVWTGRTKVTAHRDIAFMNSLPFFTYPISWTQSDANAPYFKIILPWQGYNKNTEKYDVDPNTGEQKAQEFYYKITIPDLNEFRSNTSYRIMLDIAVLGNQADDLPVELSGDYYVVGWDDPMDMGGNLDAGSYLSVRDTLYMYGTDELDIATITSHSLESVSFSSKWYDYYNLGEKEGLPENSPAATYTINGSTVKFRHALRSKLADITTTGVDVSAITFDMTITNAAGASRDVTIIQYPPIYIDTKPGGNVFVNGYFAHVLDADGNGVGQWATANGSGYYSSSRLSSGNNGGYVLSNGMAADSQYPFTRGYGPVSEQNPYAQKDLVRLNISSIPSDLTFKDHTGEDVHYIIGDPREGSGWNDRMFDYKTGTNTTGDWSDKADIKKGTTQTNIIAPSLIFSSGWSTMYAYNTSPSWQIAANRCATYQEGGYPAGRWRLATEAEINFVRLLQDNNLIQDIFADNNYYSSSGYTFNGSSYNGPYIDSQQTGGYIRCVYDIWYWGEKPETAYEYHAKP